MTADTSYRSRLNPESPFFLFLPRTVALLLSSIAVLTVSIRVLGEVTSYSELHEPRFAWLLAVRPHQLLIRYEALLLIICALLITRVALMQPTKPNSQRFQWGFMAFTFAALGVAKVTSLLQVAMGFVRSVDGRIGLPLTMPAITIALLSVLALPYWKFLKKLEPQLRNRLIVGGIFYFSGAVLMEAVSEFLWNFGGSESLAYIMVSAAEELLEMGGCIVIAIALLSHILPKHEDVLPDRPETG